jgi:glycosyltransferase involved in cell wall biosynthesis
MIDAPSPLLNTGFNPRDPINRCAEPQRVSVIIPTHNRRDMVRRAIDSVLAQDYSPIELIVVDDGSTDNTRAALEDYGDAICLLTQRHQGVSAARNRGIRSAKAELIALLDSDDYWLPEKVLRQVEFFRLHPEALICQTQEIWIRNGRRVNPKHRHQKPSGMIFEPSLALCLVSPSAVMMRTELLKECGLFDESLQACEDYDLWLRIACKYPIHLIDCPLIVKCGGHADQLSRIPELDRFRIQSIAKILHQGCLTLTQQRAAVIMLKQKCAIYAGGCVKRGKMKEADFYHALAQRWD